MSLGGSGVSGGGGSGVVVDEGGSLKLKCRAANAKEGNPAASLRWEKNGREIAPALRIRLRTRK